MVRIDSRRDPGNPETRQRVVSETTNPELDEEIRFSNTKLAKMIARGQTAENTGVMGLVVTSPSQTGTNDEASSVPQTTNSPGALRLNKMTAIKKITEEFSQPFADPDQQGADSIGTNTAAATARANNLNQVLNQIVLMNLPDEELEGLNKLASTTK